MFRDFTYDLENKLVSALPSNAGIRTLSYDPLNRLDVYNPGTAKRFIYDGAEVIAELDASGNIVGRYVRGDGADEIITGYTSSDPTARGWYHLEQRNSVIAVTDPNGTVTVLNRYDEYGQPQGGNYGTFQYTGQMWLGEIGVYNYKNRMYWPNERPGGRFLQADPVGYAPGMNRYAYTANNPINATDPSGLDGTELSRLMDDDRSAHIDFTPRGSGWGSRSWDWMGGTATHVSGRLDEILLDVRLPRAFRQLTALAASTGITAQCLLTCTYDFIRSQMEGIQVAQNWGFPPEARPNAANDNDATLADTCARMARVCRSQANRITDWALQRDYLQACIVATNSCYERHYDPSLKTDFTITFPDGTLIIVKPGGRVIIRSVRQSWPR